MPNFRSMPNKNLCKLGKEYLNNLLCKFGPFCLQHSKNFDISQAFLWVTTAELSTLKQVRFFWPTLSYATTTSTRTKTTMMTTTTTAATTNTTTTTLTDVGCSAQG